MCKAGNKPFRQMSSLLFALLSSSIILLSSFLYLLLLRLVDRAVNAVSSVPAMLFGNAPRNRTAHWEAGPNTRGSASILLSCIITLGICVWTSVHLNIPRRGKDKARRWWDPRRWTSTRRRRKVAWLLLGMLTPEVVIFAAFWQWRDARKLTKGMRAIFEAQVSTSRNTRRQDHIEQTDDIEMASVSAYILPRKYTWTMAHSFYVVMGGFVFDSRDLPQDKQFLPEKRLYFSIGPRAFQELAKCEPCLVPDISASYIADKSKANKLAKVIACVQATWFVTQCVYRLSSQLPISLLELTTWAHCICTLITYAFWWSKPLDIDEATTLSDSALHGVCAALYVCHYEPYMIPKTALESAEVIHEAERACRALEKMPSRPMPKHEVDTGRPGILFHGQQVHDFFYLPVTCCWGPRATSSSRRFHVAYKGILQHRTSARLCERRDYERWELSSKYLSIFDSYSHHERALYIKPDLAQRLSDFLNLRVAVVSSPASAGFEAFKRDPILTTLCLAGAFYGGLHLIAWDAPFTSDVQRFLWRVSGITVIVAGPLYLLAAFVEGCAESFLYHRYRDGGSPRLTTLLKYLLVSLGIGLCGLFCIFYVLVRIFLIVECFIFFAYLPPAVFQEPQWQYFFPHIG